MTLTLANILAASGAEVLRLDAQGELKPGALARAELQERIVDVTVDSRAIRDESLFVALEGERVDGHAFVADAFRAGALACLVSHVPSNLAGFVPQDGSPRFLLVVPNALAALQRIGRYWRQVHNVTVVGITGSIGKTTTKEVVASLLASRFTVLRSEGNFNTEIGLPLQLLKLNREYDVAVLEMGMYTPGDIALLADIARPDIGIVTNVAPIHLERAGTIERIARGKSELIAALPPHALALLNADDPWTRAMARATAMCRVRLAGLAEDADIRADAIELLGLEGVRFRLFAEGTELRVQTNVPGVHTVHAFLFAAGIARELGLEWPEIGEAVASVRQEARQRTIRGVTGMIIDDTYNAAPPSMRAALGLLRVAEGTKIAVLGDMLELGPAERSAHEEIGRAAAEIADWLVVRGSRAAWIADAAIAAGMSEQRLVRSADNIGAAEAVRAILDRVPATSGVESSPTMQRSDAVGSAQGQVAWTVLVKGSRGMRMEEVVEALRGYV